MSQRKQNKKPDWSAWMNLKVREPKDYLVEMYLINFYFANIKINVVYDTLSVTFLINSPMTLSMPQFLFEKDSSENNVVKLLILL